jgi:hypothetical protein
VVTPHGSSNPKQHTVPRRTSPPPNNNNNNPSSPVRKRQPLKQQSPPVPPFGAPGTPNKNATNSRSAGKIDHLIPEMYRKDRRAGKNGPVSTTTPTTTTGPAGELTEDQMREIWYAIRQEQSARDDAQYQAAPIQPLISQTLQMLQDAKKQQEECEDDDHDTGSTTQSNSGDGTTSAFYQRKMERKLASFFDSSSHHSVSHSSSPSSSSSIRDDDDCSSCSSDLDDGLFRGH